MKTYKAFIKQEGDGCDYTIACGKTVINLDAESMEEAMLELMKEIKESYSDEERRLERAVIFEVNQIYEMDLLDVYKRIDNAEYEAQQKAKEDSERKEFERLQSKFGNGKERPNIQV